MNTKQNKKNEITMTMEESSTLEKWMRTIGLEESS